MTRPLLLLALVASLTYGVRSFIPGGAVFTGSGAALAFGFLLIAAVQTGHVFHALRLPHLTGYLLCGAVFGPELLGLLSGGMVRDLALVKHVAVGLIALLAGCELNLRLLRPALRAISAFSLGAMVCSGVLLFALFYYATGQLPATAGFSELQRFAVALLAANALIAFSPAVVMGIITETRAAGPLSRLSLSIVVLADLVIALTFSVSNSYARTVLPVGPGAAAAGLGGVATHVVLSLAAGAVLGAGMALYITRVGKRVGLFVFGALFIAAEAGFALGIDPLLTGLAAGLFVENVSPVSGNQVIRETEPATLPTFVIFFGVIGSEIQVREFLMVAPWAAAAFATRAAGILLGTRLVRRLAAAEPAAARLIPLGLIPQTGVALALANLVRDAFAPWGSEVATLLLGAIVLNQLVGPVLFRQALAAAGEIGSRVEVGEPAATEAEAAPGADAAPATA